MKKLKKKNNNNNLFSYILFQLAKIDLWKITLPKGVSRIVMEPYLIGNRIYFYDKVSSQNTKNNNNNINNRTATTTTTITTSTFFCFLFSRAQHTPNSFVTPVLRCSQGTRTWNATRRCSTNTSASSVFTLDVPSPQPQNTLCSSTLWCNTSRSKDLFVVVVNAWGTTLRWPVIIIIVNQRSLPWQSLCHWSGRLIPYSARTTMVMMMLMMRLSEVRSFHFFTFHFLLHGFSPRFMCDCVSTWSCTKPWNEILLHAMSQKKSQTLPWISGLKWCNCKINTILLGNPDDIVGRKSAHFLLFPTH